MIAEGPIVQSLYDLALLSWSNALKPPLPLLSNPPSYQHPLTADHFEFGSDHPLVSTKGDLETSASKARQTLASHHAETETFQEEVDQGDGQSTQSKRTEVWDKTNADEAERVDGQFGSEQAITEHLSTSPIGIFRDK